MSKSVQNDNFLKKYQEIQPKLDDINNFFSLDAPTNINAKMLNDYGVLQRVSRANYIKIFAFDKYLPLPLSEEQLIESFVNQDKLMHQLIPNPNIFQTVTLCIKYIYQKENLSKKLADFTYSYFLDKPDDLPIFAYVTFPAIYGFFITIDHLKYAYDFISSLLQINFNFFMPFFVSYLTSANLFVEIFWYQFFGLIDLNSRHKPSIGQLYEYLFQALEYSMNYLNTYHLMICTEFLGAEPSMFFECFFRRFLLSTFKAWASYNPGVSSSKVTEEDLEALFRFIVENPDGIFNSNFTAILSSKSCTINQLESFVENTGEPKLIYIFSPKELKILSQLFHLIPELTKVIFNYKNFSNINFDSFVAGSVEVFHDNLTKKNKLNSNEKESESTFLIYDNNESKLAKIKQQIKESQELNSEEIGRAWKTINQICTYDYCVNPYKILMTCEIEDENDDIYEKLAKKEIQKMSSDSLKKYALGILQKELMEKQIYFETYMAKHAFSESIANMKIKLSRYGEIMEELILPKLKNKDSLQSKKLFASNLIRIEMIETENFTKPNLFECQNNFFETLKCYGNQDPKFQMFLSSRDSFFAPLVVTLAKTDELSLGDRFFLLYNIYSQISILTMPIGREKMFNDPLNCLNALFAYLIVKADFRSFIKTFINICAFKKKYNDKFRLLPEEMIEKWNAIQSFVISVIQDEDFDPQSRLTILTFTK